MNTDNANKYLNERQIYQRDVWDNKDIEHPLDCLLEEYHQEQLKLLGIADVMDMLPTAMITRVEVVDENGRSYVNWKQGNKTELQVQDNGRTLKVFVSQGN